MRRPEIAKARILVVDDEQAYVDLLARYLESIGYSDVRTTTDPFEVARLVADFDPDLILLDLRMRGMDGIAVMQQLEPHTSRFYLPILVLTGDISDEAKRASLSSGARDFLNKPFDLTEVRLRIENLLETRFLHLELQRQNALIEQRVRERIRDLEDASHDAIERLAVIADYRDDATGRHARRVADLAAALARELRFQPEEAELIRSAAALHDVGKIAVPDDILLKPGPLTPEETALMQTHPAIGAKLLAGSRSRHLQLAEVVAMAHHERWDGTGYPRGLQGEQIPMAARIACLADVVDSLGSERPFREAWPFDRIRGEVRMQAGAQFDPDVVEAWFRLLDRDDANAALSS